jgi:hypothetical protein
MNKPLIIIGITLILITTGLSGCVNEKTNEKLITAPLNTLALTLEDLPEGYIERTKGGEDYNYSDKSTFHGIMTSEEYSILFIPENNENKTILLPIALYLYKFNSSDDAHIVLNNMTEMDSASKVGNFNRTTPQNVTQIGDESSYELYKISQILYNDTESYIYFRIKNVVVYLLINSRGLPGVDVDFVDLTINYAKIVENKINESLT